MTESGDGGGGICKDSKAGRSIVSVARKSTPNLRKQAAHPSPSPLTFLQTSFPGGQTYSIYMTSRATNCLANKRNQPCI
ncbi:hypothetical protein M404DRAFT_997836 [Pisolithus tinctorius Marx 270]|uniref:Uncharacterized protein n=1 Tax=Pisolithus tinctorius Marx 270 TaxID=870435 RepID=A0A0C3JF36_PISTI|nr:hypothetical protein M404DRAFT_997836 [Pisolithus tinctorius Marx 270]